MTFAERLRQLRDAKGLSQAKLADASGVSFASVREYGMSRRKPSFEAVVKLARALGVSVEAFADCEDVGGEAAPPLRPHEEEKKPERPRRRKPKK
jgi:transcriptional regulator with XRE-family HTH domain